ncbi:PREDICTED: uncharacterized protein LOC105556841 [Vollenhovia emeryi]|uniref:uncharacterized protein LOC105556841 n=1 Tax=Vollenhovia emeryi TaxID=411798 RepID=UPI0005F4D638|nr:PREDICTED: uncharacterized protein LOC105556841 [Vollenhovia emeryi]
MAAYEVAVDPLELYQLSPRINVMGIIKAFEDRCFAVYRRLRTDPQCHPKLHDYVRSFDLNREDFIRYMILHCFQPEYEYYAYELTLIFFYHFGWENKMMAYENVIRITAEALQIALLYEDHFPKHTFTTSLYAVVQFCKIFESNMLENYKAIRHILLKTLSSIKLTVNRTYYRNAYDLFLNSIRVLDPHMLRTTYYSKIYDYVFVYIYTVHPKTCVAQQNDCICCKSMYCKYHDSLIQKKLAARQKLMYNAYLFIRECLKISIPVIYNSFDRLQQKLCQTD